MSFDVPILLCVFNRPGLTTQVFEAIARQKPKRLLIAGDGPRVNRPDDQELVERTKKILERIDWNCTVQSDFSTSNLGCRAQMAKAITWGFQHCERMIILEDDCVPDDSFFPYCRELLDHYADEKRIMTVSGNTYPTSGFNDYSYRFSKYPLIWGWASWRRAWQHYDLEMQQWQDSAVRQRVLDEFMDCEAERNFWRDIFDRQSAGEINTWDYSWTFACWLNRGLTILPRQNLVSNIGFGDHATHTLDSNSPMANRLTFPIEVSNHRVGINRDREADQAIRNIVFESSADEVALLTLFRRPIVRALFTLILSESSNIAVMVSAVKWIKLLRILAVADEPP